MMRRAGGFTMVELVIVIILIGILSVVVMPRMDTQSFRALEFRDQTVAALRYAQKTATSHRRLVCVAFTASSVTLTIALTNPSATCSTNLTLPGSNNNVVQSTDPANALFSPVPTGVNFQPDGTGSDRTLNIAGLPVINVVGATGSVY